MHNRSDVAPTVLCLVPSRVLLSCAFIHRAAMRCSLLLPVLLRLLLQLLLPLLLQLLLQWLLQWLLQCNCCACAVIVITQVQAA